MIRHLDGSAIHGGRPARVRDAAAARGRARRGTRAGRGRSPGRSGPAGPRHARPRHARALPRRDRGRAHGPRGRARDAPRFRLRAHVGRTAPAGAMAREAGDRDGARAARRAPDRDRRHSSQPPHRLPAGLPEAGHGRRPRDPAHLLRPLGGRRRRPTAASPRASRRTRSPPDSRPKARPCSSTSA